MCALSLESSPSYFYGLTIPSVCCLLSSAPPLRTKSLPRSSPRGDSASLPCSPTPPTPDASCGPIPCLCALRIYSVVLSKLLPNTTVASLPWCPAHTLTHANSLGLVVARLALDHHGSVRTLLCTRSGVGGGLSLHRREQGLRKALGHTSRECAGRVPTCWPWSWHSGHLPWQ